MVPAAPLPWLTATQTPRSLALHRGMAAGDAPDEVAAYAAVEMARPATTAAATATIRRAAVVGRSFMAIVLFTWDPQCAGPSTLEDGDGGFPVSSFFAERTRLTVAITSFSPVRSAHWCGDSAGRTHRTGRGPWRGGVVLGLAGSPRRGRRRDPGRGPRRAG